MQYQGVEIVDVFNPVTRHGEVRGERSVVASGSCEGCLCCGYWKGQGKG